MTTTTPGDAAGQDHNQHRRRDAVVRFGLAVVAVVGVGAALTSATWTDDAWFSGEASSATVELQGSLDGVTWYDADTLDNSVEIPAETFENLNQGADKTVTVHLKNISTAPLTLSNGVVTTDGDVFTGATPATATVTAPGVTQLDPGATTTATLKVETPDDWPATYQGTSGTVTLQFTGTS